MQIMPFDDAADYRFNPFDLTKVWPHADYPPIQVGRMVLDRNPANFFAEVEQAGFSPANLVPGIGLSPDKMLMGRIFSYHDTHLHRIGPTTSSSRSTRPRSKCIPTTRSGDDLPPRRGQPVYAPNSYGGPQADPQRGADLGWSVDGGELGRYAYEKHADDDDFGQAGTLYRDVMNDTDREHLVTNIVGHASDRRQRRDAAARDRLLDQCRPAARRTGGRRTGHRQRESGRRPRAAELVAGRANRA